MRLRETGGKPKSRHSTGTAAIRAVAWQLPRGYPRCLVLPLPLHPLLPLPPRPTHQLLHWHVLRIGVPVPLRDGARLLHQDGGVGGEACGSGERDGRVRSEGSRDGRVRGGVEGRAVEGKRVSDSRPRGARENETRQFKAKGGNRPGESGAAWAWLRAHTGRRARHGWARGWLKPCAVAEWRDSIRQGAVRVCIKAPLPTRQHPHTHRQRRLHGSARAATPAKCAAWVTRQLQRTAAWHVGGRTDSAAHALRVRCNKTSERRWLQRTQRRSQRQPRNCHCAVRRASSTRPLLRCMRVPSAASSAGFTALRATLRSGAFSVFGQASCSGMPARQTASLQHPAKTGVSAVQRSAAQAERCPNPAPSHTRVPTTNISTAATHPPRSPGCARRF